MAEKVCCWLRGSYYRWSIIGLGIALFVALISSDHRFSDYGIRAAELGASEVIAPSTILAPAAAPRKLEQVETEMVVPDTVNGELVWPDPWDEIVSDRPYSY
ncbi:MAG: hypothetical protein AAFN92_07070 [Bacteroidota bacterium]